MRNDSDSLDQTSVFYRAKGSASNQRLLRHFRTSAAMRSYVLRLRLRGSDFYFGSDTSAAVAFTNRVNEMRRVLVGRGVPVVVADRAIMQTLELAADHQLSGIRFEQRQKMQDHARSTLNHFIAELHALRHSI